MRAKAVIGANFGDEGKGLMTDYLSGPNTVVVRYNGGAQAGHTVATPEGARHVFHHVGAGTLRGASTYLSRFFIVNPMLWDDEIAELPTSPEVFVDPHAALTTPYDMLINQEIEQARGRGKHGSCGIGINETIERGICGFGTTVADIGEGLADRLRAILNEYVPLRLNRLGIKQPSDLFLTLCQMPELIDEYLTACAQLVSQTKAADDSILDSRQVVFEGAQGLLLDEEHHFFPHVTRSKTGLHNVMKIVRGTDIDSLDVVYVTRSYMTRHGAGPFPTKDARLNFPDPTNVCNEFQGELRFGWLDIDMLAQSIRDDLEHVIGFNATPSIAVTCLDQLEIDIDRIEIECGVPVAFTSRGPTRESIDQLIPLTRLGRR